MIGKLYKSIPNHSELDSTLADLIVNSISINSGYTSMIRQSPNSDLMDQVSGGHIRLLARWGEGWGMGKYREV